MQLQTRTMTIIPGAETAVTLEYPVAMIYSAKLSDTTNGHTKLTVVNGTAAAGDIEFTGTPANPASTATLGTAAGATDAVILEVVPAGAVPANL